MGKDFDWEHSTANFDKEKAMREVEEHTLKLMNEKHNSSLKYKDESGALARSPMFESITEDLHDILNNLVIPEEAYDPNKSIFDKLSCDTFERLQSRRKPQEERKNDEDTFGPQTGPLLNPSMASGRFFQPGGPRPGSGSKPSGPRPDTGPNSHPNSVSRSELNSGHRNGGYRPDNSRTFIYKPVVRGTGTGPSYRNPPPKNTTHHPTNQKT